MTYFNHILKPYLSEKVFREFITGTGVGPILKSLSISYKSPVWYPDSVIIGTRVIPESIQRDRFTQEFVVVSQAQEKVVAQGNAVGVTYDYRKLSKVDIPKEILDAYKQGDGSFQK